jgi:hypothetical protein
MTSEPASEPTAQGPDTQGPDAKGPDAKGGMQSPLRHSSSRHLIALLAGLALAGTAYGSFPLWRDQVGLPAAPASDSFEVENLRAELSAITARLAQLEARPATASGTADNTRIDRLEEALRTAQAHAAGPAGEIDSLTKQVADLKRNSAEASAVLRLAERLELMDLAVRELQAKRSSAAALLLAAGQLREAVAA